MASQPFRLILASQSPQRQMLLKEAGYCFEVVPPSDGAETGFCSGETPAEFVARLARQKAADVAGRTEQGIVLACDTVAECGGRILGKPRHADDARQMLEYLRGRTHHVYSGLCLHRLPADETQPGKVLVETDVTTLQMLKISDAQLDEYIESRAWVGKAGAFGYQDRTGWLEILSGSESNVIGLPMELLAKMLQDI